jgi:hypothetical protein
MPNFDKRAALAVALISASACCAAISFARSNLAFVSAAVSLRSVIVSSPVNTLNSFSVIFNIV